MSALKKVVVRTRQLARHILSNTAEDSAEERERVREALEEEPHRLPLALRELHPEAHWDGKGRGLIRAPAGPRAR